MSELILYSSDDGRTRLHLRVEGESVWLSQQELAELFQTTKQNVLLHAKSIFEDGELSQEATVKESLTVQAEGGRQVRRKLIQYNLDLILAIGYRVRSPRGIQFRQWASRHLKEFLLKGFVMDDERLKNRGGWDYFDELLARIPDIRASEKRFYQKVRELFALSTDYRAHEQESAFCFAEVQNKLLYATAGDEWNALFMSAMSCSTSSARKSNVRKPILTTSRKLRSSNTASNIGWRSPEPIAQQVVTAYDTSTYSLETPFVQQAVGRIKDASSPMSSESL